MCMFKYIHYCIISTSGDWRILDFNWQFYFSLVLLLRFSYFFHSYTYKDNTYKDKTLKTFSALVDKSTANTKIYPVPAG